MKIKSFLLSAAILATVNAASMPAEASMFGDLFGQKKPAPSQQAPIIPAPVILAQAGSQGLAEEVRQLNGRLEELNFQILQLQEQMRKMQEDNEFRFQQLEGGGAKKPASSDAPTPDKQGSVEPAQRPTQEVASSASPSALPGVTPPAGTGSQTIVAAQPDAGTGAPPKDFGSITFDQSGNVTGGAVGDQTTVAPDPNAALNSSGLNDSDNTVVAALPQTNDPEKLYDSAYKSFLGGDYRTAEAGFRKLSSDFPEDSRAADTQYWLGESLLGQQKYAAAVDAFAAGSKKFPKAKRAPDMMFKLGVSLASINRRDVACAAFKAVGDRYPSASPKLLERAKAKQAEQKC